MANERSTATTVGSSRSDAVSDFHCYRCYYYFDNNTLSIITRLHSASVRGEAFIDDFLHRYCGDAWFTISQQVAGQFLVAIVLIVAVTVCDARTRALPSFVTFNTFNILGSDSVCNKVTNFKERSMDSKHRQAICNLRWSAISQDQFLFYQCNLHHREKRHRSSIHFSTLSKSIAKNNIYLLNVIVGFHSPVDSKMIVNHKKILVESIIFAYLISLDLYS